MNAVVQMEKREPTPSEQFRSQLTRQEAEIATALPPHMPVERFMRVVLTAVNGNSALLQADRRSLFESAMKAAQDGLLPDGRDGALVIYRTKVNGEWIQKVQWMPMVGGILKKIRNSGELLTISAYVAYERDEFEYSLGDEESIKHRPHLGDDRGAPKLVYAIAKTKDGGVYREIMTFADVEKVRGISRAKDNGPWKDWWDEMAKKTVIRRLAKRLPMSSDLDDLIRRDDELYDFQGKRADMDGMHKNLAGPSVMQRLQAAPAAVTDAREGFDADFVQRETENLSAPSADADGDVPQEQTDGSANDSDQSEEPTGEQAAEEPELPMDALPAAQKAELTDDDYGWLMDTARMMWAASEPGKSQILERSFESISGSVPAFVSEAAMGLGSTILNTCRKVCKGEMPKPLALKIVANAAGCSEREVTA
jgi:recombination protein RecT